MKIDELPEIDFPDSDGEPMAETDTHRKAIVRLIDQMSHRYRGEQVYVTGDLLFYYDPLSAEKRLAPDVMVVKGVRLPINVLISFGWRQSRRR